MAFFILLLAVDNVVIAQDEAGINSAHHIARVPTVEVDPISHQSRFNPNAKLNYIADSFIPIVILAYNLFEDRDFAYYLPLYNLNRQKEYFLLI